MQANESEIINTPSGNWDMVIALFPKVQKKRPGPKMEV